MGKESLFAVLMALWAVTHVKAMHTEQVSSISEKSKTSYNQNFTLEEAHQKCAEYLRSSLSEFLQKVNKTDTNDGTANMGQKVEDELNKKVHALMGRCDPTTLGVAQYVATRVDPREKGLRIEQLVIQKIQLTPNLRLVGDKGNQQMNCTNNETPAKQQVGMRTLTSKECSESQEALVAEWERQGYEIYDQAMLIEELQEEIAALKLNFSNVHQINENLLKEIDRLKQSLAEKDAEIAGMKSETIIAYSSNENLSADKIESKSQVKNPKDQNETSVINAVNMIDKNLCAEHLRQQEQGLIANFNDEKKDLIASANECADKVDQLKIEMSALLNQKGADARRCIENMEQQKKNEENLTMMFNEQKKNLVASAPECAHKLNQLQNEVFILQSQKGEMEEQMKQQQQQLTMVFNEERMVFIADANECANNVDQLKYNTTLLEGQKEAESQQCKKEMEKRKEQEEHNLMMCNEEKEALVASATEWGHKVDQLNNEISVLIIQTESENKKCNEDIEAQKEQQEQQLTMTFNEERNFFEASATECANKIDQLENEMLVVVNLMKANSKQCEEQIQALTNTMANSVDKDMYDRLKYQCDIEIDEKIKSEEEKASQKIIIDNLTIETQQVQDALASSQSTNSQTINNLQILLDNEKASVTSLAAQLQHCNQKEVDCRTNIGQKELESIQRKVELQDEKKKHDDKISLLETSIQQINLQHANEWKSCQESVTACTTETTRFENQIAEKNQQLQTCTEGNSQLTSELISTNDALTVMKEDSASITNVKGKYEKLANTCLHDTSVLMQAIGGHEKLISYWKMIESDFFTPITGLSDRAQSELKVVLQSQSNIIPLYCNHTSY